MALSVLSVVLYLGGGLLGLVCAGFLAFTAYIYYVHWKYSHLPCPKYSSFFKGHIANVLKRKGGDEEYPVMELFHEWYLETNSKTFVIFFFSVAVVIVLDPDHVKKIVMQVKNNKPKAQIKLTSHMFGERFLGDGLVTILDYNTWKPRRKIYDSAFNRIYLKSLIPSFNKCVDVFLDKVRPLANGSTPVPMRQHLTECTLYVISKVAFGSDFAETWDDKSLGLKRAKGTGKLTFLIANVIKGFSKIQTNPLFQYLHPYEAEAYRETVRAIRIIGRDCIMKRIQMIESGAEVPNDILSHILQVASTKETVDIEDLVDDFATYYLAGQETTGNLLSFAVALLHLHPLILDRVNMEVDEVLGTKQLVSGEDLDKLQYTEQVLLESLRLYPPAGGIIKELFENTVLGDHTVPAGSMVFMLTVTACRMPEYFDDPDSFDPSRFDPENRPVRIATNVLVTTTMYSVIQFSPNSFVYYPFGLGHRSCIGKHFAMMEAKMILARLIQTFKLTLPPDYKLEVSQRGIVQPKGDVPCTVELREN